MSQDATLEAVTVRDMAATLCFLRRHRHSAEEETCRRCPREAATIVEMLHLRQRMRRDRDNDRSLQTALGRGEVRGAVAAVARDVEPGPRDR